MKKIVYEEPKMPPALREALGMDGRDKKGKRKRPAQGKNTGARQNKKTSDTKKPKKVLKNSASNKVKKPTKKKVATYDREASNSRNKKNRASEYKKPTSNKNFRETRSGNNTSDKNFRSNTKSGVKKSDSLKRESRKPNSSGLNRQYKTSRSKDKKTRRNLGIKGILLGIVYVFALTVRFVFTGGNTKKYIKPEKRKKLDSSFRRISSFAMVVVLLLFSLAMILTGDKKTSIAENRELEQRPNFNVSSFMDGKYSSNYSSYISDQFPNRSGFIKLKAKFDLLTGKDKINGVYIGKEGYLMEGFEKEQSELIRQKADSIKTFQEKHPKLRTSVMLVPNKIEIYRDMISSNVPDDSQKSYLEEFKGYLGNKVKMVDVYSAFEKSKNAEQLYYKTDHHWTSDGALLGYQTYCKSTGIMPVNTASLTRALASDSFYGSLYYKNGAEIGNPDNIYIYAQQGDLQLVTKYYDTKKKVASLYDSSKLKGRDPYEVFTGGNHSQIKIRTNVESDRKLLIIKDSYANSMLPFLVNNFSEINVIDLRYYTGTIQDILNNNDITDVLVLYNINTFNSDSSILNLNDN